MNKRMKLLLVWMLSLVLVMTMAVPAVRAQETDDGTCLWVYHRNPLYPDLPVCDQPVCPDPRAVRKNPDYRDTLPEAVEDLKEGLLDREETITVSFKGTTCQKEMAAEIFYAAAAHTGDPVEGDYLLWNYSDWNAQIKYWTQGGRYYIEITYYINYLTNSAQEKELDKAVKQLLDQLDVYKADDYEKVAAIYDYLCENVKYDHEGLQMGDRLCHSAYSALINGKAVCQGYASLFYRLALSLKVDSRVISGTGNGGAHGWNIVKLEGQYYDLDATWDATMKQNGLPYEYFLRSDDNFKDHTRDAKYLTAEFQDTYVMGKKDYAEHDQIQVGNLDGNAGVTEDDAIFLLRHVLMPSLFQVDQAVDYTHDGKVNEDDAIHLLRHILMPELFPL